MQIYRPRFLPIKHDSRAVDTHHCLVLPSGTRLPSRQKRPIFRRQLWRKHGRDTQRARFSFELPSSSNPGRQFHRSRRRLPDFLQRCLLRVLRFSYSNKHLNRHSYIQSQCFQLFHRQPLLLLCDRAQPAPDQRCRRCNCG